MEWFNSNKSNIKIKEDYELVNINTQTFNTQNQTYKKYVSTPIGSFSMLEKLKN